MPLPLKGYENPATTRTDVFANVRVSIAVCLYVPKINCEDQTACRHYILCVYMKVGLPYYILEIEMFIVIYIHRDYRQPKQAMFLSLFLA